MTSPVVMFERTAKKYIQAALAAERNGDYDVAVSNLRKAVELLEEIVRNYPDHPMIRIYARLLNYYRGKLKKLEEARVALAEAGDSEEYRVEIRGRLRAGPEEPPEFVLREKPRVTFDDIADLEEAKRAIREAIIYPIKRPDLFPLGWPRGILLYGPP